MPLVGEALNRRADLRKRLVELPQRLGASALVQEGDEPPERVEMLLAELDDLARELERLIAQINLTNATSRLPDGITVTEALARRDVLAARSAAVRFAIHAATAHAPFGRRRRSEIRLVRLVNVAALQDRLETLERSRRELETALQRHNWTTALLE